MIAEDLKSAIRVRAATTTNVTIATALVPGQTVGGRTLEDGDLILVAAQTSAQYNGLYRAATVPNRDRDFNDLDHGGSRGPEGAYDMHPGILVINEDTGDLFLCTSDRGGTLGTDTLVFSNVLASYQPLNDDLTAIAALTTTAFGRGLLELADAAAGRSELEIETGTYTPTLTNVANLDASTAFAVQYVRIGDIVIMGGLFNADATAGASTLTQMRMSLPIASAFTFSTQAGGSGATPTTPVSINADATNDDLLIQWRSPGTANVTFTFVAFYRIL